jgi:hypothetical protein
VTVDPSASWPGGGRSGFPSTGTGIGPWDGWPGRFPPLGANIGGIVTSFKEAGTGFVWAVHRFTSNAELIVRSPCPIEYLLVAGGGSGGSDRGGGGGGGGCLTGALTIPTGVYPVVIGAGGVNTTPNSQGGRGSDSTAIGLTAIGGGGGGGFRQPGSSGGSGGGGGGRGVGFPNQPGGAGVPGQGNTGGTSGSQGAAGGGKNGVPTGLTSSITGSSVTYAQGGGGSAGSPAGAANTGNGGGGGAQGFGQVGGPGGTGIFVVRYRIA